MSAQGSAYPSIACSQGVEGASAALQSQIQDAEDKVDKKLLRMFQSAVKGEKVVRALEVASQLTAVRSLEGALKLANHHRCISQYCTCLSCQFRFSMQALSRVTRC